MKVEDMKINADKYIEYIQSQVPESEVRKAIRDKIEDAICFGSPVFKTNKECKK